jgi:hypothetical protein
VAFLDKEHVFTADEAILWDAYSPPWCPWLLLLLLPCVPKAPRAVNVPEGGGGGECALPGLA